MWGRGKVAWGGVGLSRVEYHGTDAQASLGRVGPVRAAWGRGKVAWGGVGLSRVEYHGTDAEASLTSGRRPRGVGGSSACESTPKTIIVWCACSSSISVPTSCDASCECWCYHGSEPWFYDFQHQMLERMLTRHGKSEAFVEAMLGQHRHRWSRATHDQGWREVKCACAPALSRRASASLSRMNAVASDLTDVVYKKEFCDLPGICS